MFIHYRDRTVVEYNVVVQFIGKPCAQALLYDVYTTNHGLLLIAAGFALPDDALDAAITKVKVTLLVFDVHLFHIEDPIFSPTR